MLSEKDVIALVNGAIKDTPVLLENEAGEEVYQLARRHQIYGIMLYGLLNAGCKAASPVIKRLREGAYGEAVLHEQQLAAHNAIFKKLEENGIDYMPLKGMLLKALYIRPELRTMSDADILIRLADYDKISALMSGLGFLEQYESNHELVWKKDNITVEFHKHLIPSYNDDYFAYFGNGWRRAQKAENASRHYLLAEDEFIFVFTHFAKHYRDGGIGIKQLTDLFLMLEKYSLNMEYIYEELEKLGLREFFENVERTVNYWFKGGDADENVKIITGVIIQSGAYGTGESRRRAGAIREAQGRKIGTLASKTRIFLKRVFPGYYSIKATYPYLEKWPVLLPVVWIARIFYILTHRRKLSEGMKSISDLSSRQVIEMEKQLNAVGLDFDFKERKK